ncbi:NUDIX domain-containing protein [Streptomyces phaeochromogenes]|uniref:NUDIX domain-containing protein n=1 Tax=Streptomyces phaeochromogenes TaxID=1923 RepID=UPI003718B92C
MLMRDRLDVVFTDEDFADLYPVDGSPALSPGQLALVSVLQFAENLSDRVAADAVRKRIDWKYGRGPELDGPGFDSRYSASSGPGCERAIFASMKIRRNVRAVLLDGVHLVFLRRGWPGGPSYYETVGGGVEPDDADLEGALRREVMEEIGATIGPVAEFLTVTEPGERVTVVQHYFLADVLDMDLDRRNGPEMHDPDIGEFSPVRVALDVSAVAALELQPTELADYLRDHIRSWGA